MRIRIDEDRCSGHGRCYTLAPDLFEDDERGFGQVSGDGTVAPEYEAQGQAAVRACPEHAISVSP